MTTTTRNGRWPHRLGRAAGRVWRGYLRGEQRAVGWLLQRGVPRQVARVLPWIFKLALLGTLLYVAFWLALVLLAVAVAGWANTSHEEEWPFTDLTELRKTSGYDPNLYNDTSHELYTDD